MLDRWVKAGIGTMILGDLSIFRKETITDLLLYGDSFCYLAFNSMMHRLVSISITLQAFKQEIDIKKYLAHRNNRQPCEEKIYS